MPLNVNIETDYGATGDTQVATVTATISSGAVGLTVGTSIFNSSDVGKCITVPGAGTADFSPLMTTISSFNSATSVGLSCAAQRTTSSTQMLAWGTDCSTSFQQFHTAAIAASGLVTLTMPGAGYYINTDDITIYKFGMNVAQLHTIGTGNTILAGNYDLGAMSYFRSGTQAVTGRVATCNPGSTSLQLLTVADSEKFIAGYTQVQSDGLVHVTGTQLRLASIDMQGFGDPNQFYTEYLDIASVSTATGVITLTAPTKYAHSSAYPEYNTGTAFTPDCGGPATAYALSASWNCEIEHEGLRFYHPASQINSLGQSVTFTNCTWLSSLGPNPSVNGTWTANGCDLSACFVEVDKSVDHLVFENGTTCGTLWFQSASDDLLTCDNSQITFLKGTPKRAVITNNSSIGTLQMGTEAYGRTDSVAVSNSVVSAITALGVIESDVTNIYSISSGSLNESSIGSVRWGIPGTFIMFQGTNTNETGFITTYLSQPSSQTQIGILLGSTWPAVPRAGGARLDVMAHPCPRVRFSNVTGSMAAVDLSQALAYDKPYGQYTKRTYTSSNITSTSISVPCWGALSQINITVNSPFASGTYNPFGQFIAAGALAPPNYSSYSGFNPTIDLTSTGTRTITTTTISGSRGTDSLGSAPGLIWFSETLNPFSTASISSSDTGSITVEVITDQWLTRELVVMTSSQANTVRGQTRSGHVLAPLPTLASSAVFVLPVMAVSDQYQQSRLSALKTFSPTVLFSCNSTSFFPTSWPSSLATLVENCTFKSSWTVGSLISVST